MAERYQRQSALAHLHLEARAASAPASAGVVLSERAYRGQIALRGKAANRKFKAAAKAVLGVPLPTRPNTASEVKKGCCLLWLGPDEWLAAVPGGREGQVIADLYAALPEVHFAAVDASSSRTVIRLSGDRARDVLMKGCSLDLHPAVFAAGQCAQSSLARCHVLLHQTGDTPDYDVYVHRSFADYLWRWLEDAAAEYGVRVAGENT
ncbi:MAG TPA: sarcosine oxidase subunit gamma family protein [Gammaproteobacteria bacterium]